MAYGGARSPSIFVFGLLAFVGSDVRSETQCAGIFKPLPGTNHAIFAKPWATFLSEWQAAEKQNLRMIDFETYLDGSTRLYSGVFTSGTYTPTSEIGKEWTEFFAKWQVHEKAGMPLLDLEIYTEGGKTLFADIFAPGTGARAAWVGKPWPDFLAKWQELEKQGLRIFDFETYTENGQRLYAGLFKSGTGNHAAFIGKEWPEFHAKWEELEKQDLRLFDFETYTENGKQLFAGLFEPGNYPRAAWIGKDLENFTAKKHAFEKLGLALVDLEMYAGSTCADTCANTVVMPPCAGDPNCAYNYGIDATATHCEGLPGTCAAPAAGAKVVYHWPVDVERTDRFIHLSALEMTDQFLTLPYKNEPTMVKNGWRYSDNTWHHAIDFFTSPKKTFEVRATAPGKVVHVGWDNWSGNTVIISDDVGGVTDAYRTIYMHLRNGATPDCINAWTKSMPPIVGSQNGNDYSAHLLANGCVSASGLPAPHADHWGTNEKIAVSPGMIVTAGQMIGWAGETGPGGNHFPNTTINTHSHIFFAHRDQADKKFYFFDPYGIYAIPSCYPQGMTDALTTPCARYPIVWKGGKPGFP